MIINNQNIRNKIICKLNEILKLENKDNKKYIKIQKFFWKNKNIYLEKNGTRILKLNPIEHDKLKEKEKFIHIGFINSILKNCEIDKMKELIEIILIQLK